MKNVKINLDVHIIIEMHDLKRGPFKVHDVVLITTCISMFTDP